MGQKRDLTDTKRSKKLKYRNSDRHNDVMSKMSKFNQHSSLYHLELENGHRNNETVKTLICIIIWNTVYAVKRADLKAHDASPCELLAI